MTNEDFLKSLECAVTASEKAYGKESGAYIMCELMYTQVQFELAQRNDEQRRILQEEYMRGYRDGFNANNNEE